MVGRDLTCQFKKTSRFQVPRVHPRLTSAHDATLQLIRSRPKLRPVGTAYHRETSAGVNDVCVGCTCWYYMSTVRESIGRHTFALQLLTTAGVALTQISAYITHKSLTVRKTMEAMRTAYAKRRTQSQHVSNYGTRGRRSPKTLGYCERKARIVCEQDFILLNRSMNPVVEQYFWNALFVSLFFSLVRILEFLYANFS